MDYVHLVVPQNLYDELGLRPNQTISLSNPQSVDEPHENNVNAAISSEETSIVCDEPLLESCVLDGNVDNGKEQTTSIEKPGGSLLRVVVNEGNGKRKLLTYQLKSTTLLSDSESEHNSSISDCACSHSDDDDSSTVGCDEVMPETFDIGGIADEVSVHSESSRTVQSVAVHPESDGIVQSVSEHHEIVQSMAVPSSSESHNVFQGMSVNAMNAEAERVKHLNPMFCEICCRGYLSKGSFRNHIKNCGRYAKNKGKKPLYPRLCENCGRTYTDSSGYGRHKAFCEKYKQRQAERQASREIEGTPNRLSSIKAPSTPRSIRNYEQGQAEFPKYCPKCSWKCNNRNSYAYHLKTCSETIHVRSEIDSYPKTCTTCSQVYFCSSSYSKHEEECSLFKQNYANGQNLETISQLSTLNSICQMDTFESDTSTTNNYTAGEEWDKDSCSVSAVEESGKWIPFSTSSSGKMQYFVVKKNMPS